MFHWTEHNIRVHVFTCVLALQIAHLLRLRARQAGLDLSVRALHGDVRVLVPAPHQHREHLGVEHGRGLGRVY